MSGNRSRIVIVAGLMASLCGSAGASFTELTLPELNTDVRTFTDGSTYNPLFPGDHTWNGVPFTLAVDAEGDFLFLARCCSSQSGPPWSTPCNAEGFFESKGILEIFGDRVSISRPHSHLASRTEAIGQTH